MAPVALTSQAYGPPPLQFGYLETLKIGKKGEIQILTSTIKIIKKKHSSILYYTWVISNRLLNNF
jgi:hypothetical protein